MTTRSRSGVAADSGSAATDSAAAGGKSSSGAVDMRLLDGVQVSLDARLGAATLSVADLMTLKAGSVVDLDSQLNGLIELKLNGAVVARGELVAVEDHFAVRIVEIVAAP